MKRSQFLKSLIGLAAAPAIAKEIARPDVMNKGYLSAIDFLDQRDFDFTHLPILDHPRLFFPSVGDIVRNMSGEAFWVQNMTYSHIPDGEDTATMTLLRIDTGEKIIVENPDMLGYRVGVNAFRE
jgi:hypothetical protein